MKNKNKLGKRLRDTAFDAANVEVGEEQESEAPEYAVKRVKRFALRPMDVEEAIDQPRPGGAGKAGGARHPGAGRPVEL